MAKHGYISCINNFTRVTESSNTCIDHVFNRNVESNKINSIILRCYRTDHYATIQTLCDKIFKLENAGIRGLPNNLIKSFLSGRTQRVKLNDKYSDILEVSCGVPQGT